MSKIVTTTSSLLHSRKAIILALLGFFIYSASDVGVKHLSESYSTVQILFLTGIFGMIILILLTWLGLIKGAFTSRNCRLHVLRGFLIFIASGCYIYGFSLGITLTDYYALIFTGPFFATLLIAIFLKEATGVRCWLIILTGFAGVLIVIQPDITGISKGMIAVMLGVVLSAVTLLLIRFMGPNESSFLYSFFAHLFFALGTLPFLPMYFTWPRLNHWVIFILTAAGSSIATACVAVSYVKTPKTATIAPLNYSQMLWGMLFGWLFFDDIPELTAFVGAAIIILAGIYLINTEAASPTSKI
jgi:drug/metabolite transporter (DMT)-like permease